MAATTGTPAGNARGNVSRRRGSVSAAANARTRSRNSAGAATRAARSSETRSRCDIQCLFQLLQRPVQACRAVRRGYPENARGGAGVEVQDDPQRDDLALAGGEGGERRPQVGGEPVPEALPEALGGRPRLPPAR